MTREDIIAMAREAGLFVKPHGGGVWAVPIVSDLDERIERFASLVSAAERQACAELTENFDACDPKHIAAAIRARGNDD